MARISRLIIYDSDDEDTLTKQVEKSLPQGTHYLNVKITVVDLPETSELSEFIERITEINE